MASSYHDYIHLLHDHILQIYSITVGYQTSYGSQVISFRENYFGNISDELRMTDAGCTTEIINAEGETISVKLSQKGSCTSFSSAIPLQ